MFTTVEASHISGPTNPVEPPDRRSPRVRACMSLALATLFAAASFGVAGAQTTEKRGLLLPPPQEQLSSAEGSYYALVIGIDNYPSPMKKLRTAVSDATAVGKTLQDRYGFDVTYLLDQDATRANILEALHKYRNTLGSNDSLVIYYAGHGFSDRDADKSYWLPADADSGDSVNRIIADDLTSDVKVLPARHVLIISDSCYSGGLSRDADTPEDGGSQPAYLARMLKARSRTLLSSGGDEPVADNGQDGHSVFAYALLQALQRKDDPLFTASDLFYTSVRQQVAGRSEQLPQYAIIRNSNSDDGDFVFRRSVSSDADRRLKAASEVSEGKALYYAWRASEALPLFIRACDEGDPQGCRYAGGTYLQGLDQVEANPTLSEQYLRRGCDSGVMRACANLGSLYAQGRGVGQDYDQAFALYGKACDGGDAIGCKDLGDAYINGTGVAKAPDRANQFYAKDISIFRNSCDSGELVECMNLGLEYQGGRGVGEDDAQALVYFRKACDGGSLDGCDQLGNAYYNGQGVDKDYRIAVTFFRKSCDGGDSDACISLAEAYQKGEGVPVDKAQAITIYQKSCDRGSPSSCNNLGIVYLEGQGVAKDEARANEIYLKACDMGGMQACANLGADYENGMGVTQDNTRAVEFYRKACDHDAGVGCTYLGESYQAGKGVGQSEEQAVAFFRKACDDGNADGCTQLGKEYSAGKGIAKDDAQAAQLYRKACDQGDSGGCLLAPAKDTGQSGAQPAHQSIDKLFGFDEMAVKNKKDCDAGSFSSCYSVGLDYDTGIGVDQDPKLAAKFYRQACDGGVQEACDQLKSPQH